VTTRAIKGAEGGFSKSALQVGVSLLLALREKKSHGRRIQKYVFAVVSPPPH